jgi:hypothetical protein
MTFKQEGRKAGTPTNPATRKRKLAMKEINVKVTTKEKNARVYQTISKAGQVVKAINYQGIHLAEVYHCVTRDNLGKYAIRVMFMGQKTDLVWLAPRSYRGV